jgi:hypothetical protein
LMIALEGLWHEMNVWPRVARFFMPEHTKMGRNIPDDHKI